MEKTQRKPTRNTVDVEKEWLALIGLLPQGWREQAWNLGAMRRHRGLQDPEALLRMLLMHLGVGVSLKQTSAKVEQLGWGHMSAVALFKRLRVSGDWLTWMAQGLWAHGGFEGKPWHVVAVDATMVRETGVTGSTWQVHWCVDVSSLQCEFFQVTDDREGEKLARYPIHLGDLVLADRGYSNPQGVDATRQRGAHLLMRANVASLPLYAGRDGPLLNVPGRLRGMRVGEVCAWTAWVKGSAQNWHRGRLVAVRRSRVATQRELRRLKRAAKQNEPPGPLARALARYVLVWTSVPAAELPPRQVLRFYRLRWQLELVFKRAKSLMDLGQLPKRSDASSRAWLAGKLLVAMLVEKLWRQAEFFSPWGYRLGRPTEPLA